MPWPLLGIIAAQIVLSVRLVWSNTAFQDEALYLWAGHLEIAHWLHGTAIPAFPAFFSGAPVLYPPLAAVADSLGGLAAARLLSLCFMLGATTLLWACTRRLYGPRAAFAAAALFAMLGPTLHLSALATFDAPSLLLLALATWLVLRAGESMDATGWMVCAAIAMALANAVAYSSAIFDPVVIVVAYLAALPNPGGKYAVGRAASLLAYACTILVLALTLGGGGYVAGIGQTTVLRVAGATSSLEVLLVAWRWTWPVLVLAAVGAAICLIQPRPRRRALLPALLAGAALLVPLEQARLHTLTSLDKHADVGAWFAAIAAGFAVDRLMVMLHRPVLRSGAYVIAAGALAAAAGTGMAQAQALFSWPNAAQFVSALGPYVRSTSGPVLAENASLPEFYLSAGSQWRRWSTTTSITLPDGGSISAPVAGQPNPAVYLSKLKTGFFSLVALNGSASVLDRRISSFLDHHHRYYQVVAEPPYGSGNGHYTIWMRRSPAGPAGRGSDRLASGPGRQNRAGRAHRSGWHGAAFPRRDGAAFPRLHGRWWRDRSGWPRGNGRNDPPPPPRGEGPQPGWHRARGMRRDWRGRGLDGGRDRGRGLDPGLGWDRWLRWHQRHAWQYDYGWRDR